MRVSRWFLARCLLAVVLCTTFALPAGLSARRAARDQRMLARGIKLYNEARFRRSLTTLKKALRYAKKPELRAQVQLYIGLDESVLGAKERAVAAFRAALIDDPSIELDPARFKPGDIALFKKAHAGLEGSVRVNATHGDGATVTIDGRSRGEVPLTTTLPIGKHVVVVKRDTTEQRREILVRSGSTVELAVIFAPRTTRPVVGTTKPLPIVDTPKDPPITPEKPRSAWSLSHSRLWTWIALGTSAAAGGAALGVGLAARADAEEYRTTNDPTQLQPLKDGATSKMLVSNILAGVAGAALIATVVLYYFEGKSGTTKRSERLEAAARRSWARRLQVGPTGLSVSF